MLKRLSMFVPALLLASGPALAGPSTSLNSLTSGDSLTSDNGKLHFSEFKYIPINNAPTSDAIKVKTLDSGLIFGAPVFSTGDTMDYNIQYTVTGLGAMINSVTMQSTGSGTGTGIAGIFKVVEGQQDVGLANLTNVFGANITVGTTAQSFDPQSSILVRDDVFLIPGSAGTAGISDFSQTFGTDGGNGGGPTAIPSPTAALAGLALMGIVGLRRRRREDAVVTKN